jgi:hypothetical protein
MIFHVKGDPDEGISFKRSNIEPIMFISKILTSAETRYGPTELEMAGVVWIVKKSATSDRGAKKAANNHLHRSFGSSSNRKADVFDHVQH